MRKFANLISISFLVLYMTFINTSQTTTFSEIPKWVPDKNYNKKDIVTHEYFIYINLLPSINEQPDTNPQKWLQLKVDKHNKFNPNALYQLGDVVEFNGKFYLSKQLNKPSNINNLKSQDKWFEFSHPASTYELPSNIAVIQIDKARRAYDNNKNNIRDDYELRVIFSGLEPATIDLALAAGKVYGQLIDVSSKNISLTDEHAKNLLSSLVYSGQCKRQIRQTGKEVWRESWYFNNFERIRLKYKNQNILVDLINETEFETEDKDPCLELQNIMSKVQTKKSGK